MAAVRVAYIVGLVFAVDLSFGFHGCVYRFLYEHVMPFRALRAPALAAILVGFSLAVLAGYGAARISSRLRSARARAMLALALSGAVLVECRSSPLRLRTVPGGPPAIYADLLDDIRRSGRTPPAVIVEVPMFREEPTYMYYSLFHWQRLVNGYSGFYPPSYIRLVEAMQLFPDDFALRALRASGARYALIHGELLEADEYRRIVRRVDTCRCGLRLVGRRPWQDREISLYQLE